LTDPHVDINIILDGYLMIQERDMAEKVYTTEEAAEHLRVKPITIRRYLKSGKLKGIKLGKEWRIPDSDMQGLIDRLKAERKDQA
jgi:excisionase family DNA binding protein